MKKAVFLYDYTGIMAQPWRDAGYSMVSTFQALPAKVIWLKSECGLMLKK